jgi:hypothetical protein
MCHPINETIAQMAKYRPENFFLAGWTSIGDQVFLPRTKDRHGNKQAQWRFLKPATSLVNCPAQCVYVNTTIHRSLCKVDWTEASTHFPGWAIRQKTPGAWVPSSRQRLGMGMGKSGRITSNQLPPYTHCLAQSICKSFLWLCKVGYLEVEEPSM